MPTAARLIAPTLDRRDWSAGYAWVIDALKQDHKQLASEMEIEKALQHLKHREFEKAIETLKHLEKKEERVRVMAATNLSFIYFLEGDLTSAERYAKLVRSRDARALEEVGELTEGASSPASEDIHDPHWRRCRRRRQPHSPRAHRPGRRLFFRIRSTRIESRRHCRSSPL